MGVYGADCQIRCLLLLSVDFDLEMSVTLPLAVPVSVQLDCSPEVQMYPLELLTVVLFTQLAAIKLSRYGEDLLFYLYYMNGGDLLQLLAAVEL